MRARPPQGEVIGDVSTDDPRDDPVDGSFALYSKATGEQRFDQPVTDGDVEPAMPTPTFDVYRSKAHDRATHLVDLGLIEVSWMACLWGRA